MAMGRRRREEQGELFILTQELARPQGHIFYDRLNCLLAEGGFDDFAEAACAPYYKEGPGRPSIPPGVYFRMIFVGYFEGLDSQRGIAWRCHDSLTVRGFLGVPLTKDTPDHSTLTNTRDRLPREVHEKILEFAVRLAKAKNLVDGKTVAVDSTYLEANAAMKSIVRKDSGENYREYLRRLFEEQEGRADPTPEELQRFDRKRRGKKCSNQDWRSRTDPESEIAKMKDGRTHLAYKAEHVVDLESDLVLAAEIRPATAGDAETITDSVLAAQGHLDAAATLQPEPDGEERIEQRVGAGARIEEVTADKGYHKASTLELLADLGIRTYIPEPKRQHKSRWRDKPAKQKQAVYANRRRTKRAKGKHLQRRRSEKVERSFAHICETGGARRTWLRGLEKIRKRYLLQAAAYDLGVVMRKLFGMGKPKTLQKGGEGVFARTSAALLQVWATCWALVNRSPWRPLRGRPLPPTPSAYPATRLAG